MSLVTNIILTTSILYTSIPIRINEFLISSGHSPLFCCNEFYNLECSIWIGTANHLDIKGLRRVYTKALEESQFKSAF